MAAAPDLSTRDSVDLPEAVALITEATEEPVESAVGDQPGGEASAAPPPAEATPAEAQPPAAEAPAGAEAEAAAEDAAPDFWSDEDKAGWAKIPAELRPVLAKYEQQRLDFVAESTRKASEERDEAMRVAQAANATVEQAADWWRKNGEAFHRAFVDRWSRVDWKALAEKDPAEVGRLIQQRQEEEALLAEATRRGEADIAAAAEKAAKDLEEAKRVESGKLAAKLPEWFGTPQVAERTWDDVRRYLFGKGFAPERINNVYEAAIVEIALNSMRFEHARALADAARQRSRDGTSAGRSAQPAAAAAPARVSPGPITPQVDRASDAARRVSERFRQSGGASIADAAELIKLNNL